MLKQRKLINLKSMSNVLHLIRKDTQLKSSFIANQINHHIDFKPFVVYRENRTDRNELGYGDFDFEQVKQLDLSACESWFEQLLGKTWRTLTSRQIKKVNDFIAAHDIEVLHFHYGTDCGIYHPLLKHVDIPSVVSFYGYDALSFQNKFMGFGRVYLRQRVFSRVDRVFPMTEEMKKDLLRAGCPEEKLFVHYHGVPSHLFSGHKTDYDPVDEGLTLMMLSSLKPVKGHLFMLQAMNALRQRGVKDVKLKIAGGGSGAYVSIVEDYIATNGLEGQVRFLGPLEYGSQEMLDELAGTDVFVHPSVIDQDKSKEGVPGALVEAMFAGLPVIATYHGGIPHVVESGKTGLLVEEWDVEALATSIAKLKNDRAFRQQLGQAGQEYALQHLALEKREQSLENHYTSLVEQYKRQDQTLHL